MPSAFRNTRGIYPNGLCQCRANVSRRAKRHQSSACMECSSTSHTGTAILFGQVPWHAGLIKLLHASPVLHASRGTIITRRRAPSRSSGSAWSPKLNLRDTSMLVRYAPWADSLPSSSQNALNVVKSDVVLSSTHAAVAPAKKT